MLVCCDSAILIGYRSASDIKPKQGISKRSIFHRDICVSTTIYQQAKLKRSAGEKLKDMYFR